MQNEGVLTVAPDAKQLTPDSGLEWNMGFSSQRVVPTAESRARALQTGAGGLGLVLPS